eukprot:jgi/Mesvir1/8079/Mv25264-RA.1
MPVATAQQAVVPLLHAFQVPVLTKRYGCRPPPLRFAPGCQPGTIGPRQVSIDHPTAGAARVTCDDPVRKGRGPGSL